MNNEYPVFEFDLRSYTLTCGALDSTNLRKLDYGIAPDKQIVVGYLTVTSYAAVA